MTANPTKSERIILQVSKYRSMNVSTMTDARVHTNYVVQTGEIPRRHTHEEYMDVSAPAGLPVISFSMHNKIWSSCQP